MRLQVDVNRLDVLDQVCREGGTKPDVSVDALVDCRHTT